MPKGGRRLVLAWEERCRGTAVEPAGLRLTRPTFGGRTGGVKANPPYLGVEAAAFELLAGEADAGAEEVAVFFAFVREFFLQLGDAFFVGLDALVERGVELFEAALELVHPGLGFLLGGEEFGAVAEEGADEFLLHLRESSGADGFGGVVGAGPREKGVVAPVGFGGVVDEGECFAWRGTKCGAAGWSAIVCSGFAGTLESVEADECQEGGAAGGDEGPVGGGEFEG